MTGRSVLTEGFDTLRVEAEGSVLVVTLDHTHNELNLFTWERMDELARLMSLLRSETAHRAIVLTGSGRFFSAGGSFALFETLNRTQSIERMGRLTRQLYGDMLSVGLPIVCALNGPAHGAGCSLVLLSDIVFAPETVTLSDPHVPRGLAAGDGPALWSLFMGPVRAKRFLLTGEELTAEQARDFGMFTFVCPPGETFERALRYAKDLAAGVPNAIAHTKLLCNRYIRDSLERTLDVGFGLEMLDFQSADHREAIAAFRQSRPPTYGGV
jgi:enoyl-CoA hydratase